MFDFEFPPERMSRGLHITLEGGVREDLYRETFPDARDDEMMSLFDMCDIICQSAGELGIAIAERRLRDTDFEPRMTQQYPFLADEDIALLHQAALRAAR